VRSSGRFLPVILLPGLRIEVLGNYLASLGLLRLLARRWPSVSVAWRDGVLCVVGGPRDLDELLDVLVEIARSCAWTPYNRGWSNEQKRSTKEKSGRPLALWQTNAEETELELFCAHAVPRERVEFNPLLGTGGNAGQREFAKGWIEAVKQLAKPPARVNSRQELDAWLTGQPVTWMVSGIAAASWFSGANKLYNSGQSAYREEPLCPWAMAVACEGLSFFAGAASRRLGAWARTQGAFPFVCQPAAPTTAEEAGRDRGEVWAPIWERPMTLAEVRALFQRGRAEVRGRGANTPAAFAAAIVQRGVDAGVAAFARFALGKTTSANTFEPRYEGLIVVQPSEPRQADSRVRSTTIGRVLGLLERLPADRKVGNRWRFLGLRGPLESGMVRLAQTRNDPVAFCTLLDRVVAALDRVDRNVSHRQRRVRWEPLPLDELVTLFERDIPSLEARLAISLASAFPVSRPFTLYRFGVEEKYGQFEHPESPPARWVFRAGPLARVLSDVVMRFTLDWESERNRGSEVGQRKMPIATSAADVQHWLDGQVDERLLARWLGRVALFDWRNISQTLRQCFRCESSLPPADGPLLLLGLLQPLFDARPLRLPNFPERPNVLSEETGARTGGAARTIAALVRTGQVDAAVRMARGRYAMADAPLMRTEESWIVADPERLLAALLIPIDHRERSALVQRWLRPQRQKGGYVHA
jgi:CRISPR-associated protein Csx17